MTVIELEDIGDYKDNFIFSYQGLRIEGCYMESQHYDPVAHRMHLSGWAWDVPEGTDVSSEVVKNLDLAFQTLNKAWDGGSYTNIPPRDFIVKFLPENP